LCASESRQGDDTQLIGLKVRWEGSILYGGIGETDIFVTPDVSEIRCHRWYALLPREGRRSSDQTLPCAISP